MFKKDFNTQLVIHIYIDSQFSFTHYVNPLSTLEQLKQVILSKTQEYSVNYKMEYCESDISKLDTFTLFQIFNNEFKDEYIIEITRISTLKKYENQRVLMTYKGGDTQIIVFHFMTMKWSKQTPNIAQSVPFSESKRLPRNSKYCHNISQNQIIITGGVDFPDLACYYDYDTNALINYPKMPVKRDRHSLIYVGNDRVFIVGGDNCKKVTCLNVGYEYYDEYPDMKLERKDPSLCYVNEQYLYVFMGYGNKEQKHLNNFERLDISVDPYSDSWKLIPLYNPHDVLMPKSYSGVVYIDKENEFIFFGGSILGSMDNKVIKLKSTQNKDVWQFEKVRNHALPFKAAFGETSFVKPNEEVNEFFQFCFQSEQLIHFDYTNDILEEIQPE